MSVSNYAPKNRQLDLTSDKVIFRRIRGRVIPVRIPLHERAGMYLKNAIAPAVTAGVISQGIQMTQAARKAGIPVLSKANALKFANFGTLKSLGKVAGLAVAFSLGYNLVMGKRQKNIVELDHAPKPKTKARIWLGSKPGFSKSANLPGHHLGEHSFLMVRDEKGKTTTFGGQIKSWNPFKYGKTGVKVVKNFPTDKMSVARNIHDLTPSGDKTAERTVEKVIRNAAELKKQLKGSEYPYRTIPIKKGTYNSNSVVGTLVRRSKLSFHYHPKKHNLPGFNRTIPQE